MTFNQAKRELISYGRIVRKELGILDLIETLKSKCTKITSTFSDMPKGSYDVHKMETAMAELADEIDNYFNTLEKEFALRKTIKSKIETLNDISQAILTKRFLSMKSIHDTADELGYTERWTKKLINKAIYEYSQIGHQKTLEDTP